MYHVIDTWKIIDQNQNSIPSLHFIAKSLHVSLRNSDTDPEELWNVLTLGNVMNKNALKL